MLAEIKRWLALMDLELREATLTDDGLRHLQECKSLKSLAIGSRQKLSQAAIDELRKALPDCEVRVNVESVAGQ